MSASAVYRVQAYNAAHASENKIHDDAVAQRFGFSGGLVPGAEIYAYMTHLPVQRWGREWLERGAAECRFVKPVYDGDSAEVTATESGAELRIKVSSRGELCAEGSAAISDAPVQLSEFADAPPVPRPDLRPPADERTLAEGAAFFITPVRVTPEFLTQYLAEVRETDQLYVREGLTHPGLMLRLCNTALRENVALGPWIHVGSTIRHFAASRIGDELSVRSRVTANYERKGHRFVDLDALILSNGTNPIARVKHVAIYRPRQMAEQAGF